MTEGTESPKPTRDEARRQAIYLRLENGRHELHGRLGGLPSPVEAEDIWGDIWYEEAHHSTSLAGNALPITEVRRVLGNQREGQATSGRERLEVLGYGEASQWIYEQALTPDTDDGAVLRLREVRHAHAVMISRVWEEHPHRDAGDGKGPGCFRRHD